MFMTLRHLVQVIVVRDQRRLALFRQLEQPGLHVLCVGEVGIVDLDGQPLGLLQGLDDVQSSAAAVALEQILTVGNGLELVEHEARHNQPALAEARLAHLNDSSVNDRRAVEHLGTACARALLLLNQQRRQRVPADQHSHNAQDQKA